jgi:pyridoxine 4-dehydrogenase
VERAGKCRYVGLSNVSVAQIETANRIVDVVSVQNRLNPYFREAVDDGVVSECERRGIVFLAYSPVGGGRLAKKLPKLEVIRRIADAHNASPHAVTIAWVRSKGATVVPIPGARSEAHAIDSASAANIALTAEEIASIDSAEFSRA